MGHRDQALSLSDRLDHDAPATLDTMSGRRTYERRPAARTPRQRGPHLGPIGISPIRVILFIALLGGLGFLGYAVFVRDQLQVPLMASGFAVVGIVFGAMAVLALLSVVRAGREGRDGTAVLVSVFGGLLALASLLALAVAVIMSLLWSGTEGA
jgi:hypothetical protein